MIAANDTDISFLLEMAPDQLRAVLAHAGGLLAFTAGQESAARTMRRIADRLLAPEYDKLDWLTWKSTLSTATFNAVIREVSDATTITPEEILSPNKKAPVVRARMYAMWKLREIKNDAGVPKYSFPEIGRAFGRDHTTVMHACRVVRLAIAKEADAKAAQVAA